MNVSRRSLLLGGSTLAMGVAASGRSIAQVSKNILILGTSTTQGMGAVPTSNRYASLVEAARPADTFTIDGRGGTTLADPATPNWLAYQVPSGYDTAVLQFGFNEWNRSTPVATFKTWATDFMTRVRTANPNIPIIWVSQRISQYTPTSLPDTRAELWQAYGQGIDQALRAMGGVTMHVDIDPTGSRRAAAPYAMQAWGTPGYDGLHYNNKGHKEIADAVIAALQEVLGG